MPANMLPADFYHTSPEHSHPPLVVMLTLTQLSVGAFTLTFAAERVFGQRPGGPLAQTVLACALAVVALIASVFHLGRPWLAWRVFLGIKTSWLSREAIAFGVFAQLGILYGLLTLAPLLPRFPGKDALFALAPFVQAAAASMGVLGVFFSVMVYAATRRAHWSGLQTGFKFFATMALLGASSVLLVHASTRGALDALARSLLTFVVLVTLVKLAFEARVLTELRNRRQSAGKRVALLLTGELAPYTKARFGLATLGGVLAPSVAHAGLRALPLAMTCGVSLLALTAGELLERYLFFRAAPASRMPGGLQ
jgi:DMSO reductase anchor subunit